MTDHKKLIEELRAAADECLYDTANLCRRAADALEAATTEPEGEQYQASCGSWDCRAPECGRSENA